MLDSLKSVSASKSRSFFINTSALLALQVANYVLPFLLIPYLIRVLGASLYGVVAFGLSMVQISYIITDFGFSLSATYSIAKKQDDKGYIEKVIGAVFACKIGLLVVVVLLFGIYLMLQTKYTSFELFLWLMLLPVIGQAFQPLWFFQGIERMVYITLYTVISRIIYLGLVILLVKVPSDYYLVAVANGFAQIFAASIGIIMMVKLGYKFLWPGWRFTKVTFMHSMDFFWSRAAVATYTACGVFFLGIVSTPLQVAYYSAAEQLYKGAQAMFSPVSQALYPHMAKHKNFPLFFRTLKSVLLANFVGVITAIYVGPFVLELLFGPEFSASFPVLLTFLLIFTVSTPSILFGYPFLGSLGQAKLANKSVIYAGVLQIMILGVCYLQDWTSAFNVVITVFLVECFVLISRVNWSVKYYKAFKEKKFAVQ